MPKLPPLYMLIKYNLFAGFPIIETMQDKYKKSKGNAGLEGVQFQLNLLTVVSTKFPSEEKELENLHGESRGWKIRRPRNGVARQKCFVACQVQTEQENQQRSAIIMQFEER